MTRPLRGGNVTMGRNEVLRGEGRQRGHKRVWLSLAKLHRVFSDPRELQCLLRDREDLPDGKEEAGEMARESGGWMGAQTCF